MGNYIKGGVNNYLTWPASERGPSSVSTQQGSASNEGSFMYQQDSQVTIDN